MVSHKDGYVSVGLTKTDLYNYLDKNMCVIIIDDDVDASLNYLNVKSPIDPMLYVGYAVNSDGRMKSLFWVDGSSKSNYFVLATWLRSTQFTRRTNITGYIFRV